MSRIFVSHSSRNNDKALLLRDWLLQNGWSDFFLDLDPDRGLAAGDQWQAALRRAADRCQAVLFLISPEWLASRWCMAEFMLAKQLGKRLFPLLISDVSINLLPVDMTANHQVVNLAWDPHGWDRLKEGLRRAGLSPEAFAFPKGRRPYPGFEHLSEDDAAIFFGREAHVVRGLDRIRSMADAGVEQILVILGASGAGKSSFMRAGLFPRLKRDDRNFLPLPIIRPERDVLGGKFGLSASLEMALKDRQTSFATSSGLPRARAAIGELLRSEPDGLAKLLSGLRDANRSVVMAEDGAPSPVVVVMVDQAEELFNEEGRGSSQRFLALLANALRADHRLLLVLAMRSDSYPCLQSEEILGQIQKIPFDLPPLQEGSLRLVIEGPARVADPPLKLDPALVDALLHDAAGPDTLPLLALTLGRLYQDFGADGHLTLSQYERRGGIRGAISDAVAEVVDRGRVNRLLPKDNAALEVLIRRAFIPHLARVDKSGRFGRRIAAEEDIPAECQPLINLLVEARLLLRDFRPMPSGGAEIVEVAHEALLREWPLLRNWLEEDREFLVGKEQLAEDIATWNGAQRRAEALLSGLKLTRSREWLEKRAADFSNAERSYIRLSIERFESSQRRRKHLTYTAIGALSVLTVFALWQWLDATKAKNKSEQWLQLTRNLSDRTAVFVARDLQQAQGIRTATVERLLDGVRNLYESLPTELRSQPSSQESRAQLMSEFGAAYLKAGVLLKAVAAHEEAASIYKALLTNNPDRMDWQRGLAQQIEQIGVTKWRRGNLQEAITELLTALDVRLKIAAKEPEKFDSERDLASSYFNLAEVYSKQKNKRNEAGDNYGLARAHIERAISISGGSEPLSLRLSEILVGIASIYAISNNQEERLKYNMDALKIRQALLNNHPDNTDYKRLLGWAYVWVASSYEGLENFKEALDFYSKAFRVRKELFDIDPTNRMTQADLGWAYYYIGNLLKNENKFEDALQRYDQAFEIRKQLKAIDPDNGRYRKDYALSFYAYGEIAELRGLMKEAELYYKSAQDEFSYLVAVDPASSDYEYWLKRIAAKLESMRPLIDNGKKSSVLQTPNVTIGETSQAAR